MTIKEQFQGMSPHRLEREPLERRFAEAWQTLNDTEAPGKSKSTLDYLMDKDNKGTPKPPLSERDWLVANTVVQWLGSPVGQHFVASVICQEDGKVFLEKLVSAIETQAKKETD